MVYHGGMADDTALRICIRVTDSPMMKLSNPSAVVQHCSRCDGEVWVDADYPVPPRVAALPIDNICFGCAIIDPEIGPTLVPNMIRAVQAHELGTELPWWAVELEPKEGA